MTNRTSKSAPSSAEVTRLLLAWNAGDERALEALVPVVYRELKRIAGRYMAAERTDHTLQASALVNEAYLKLIDARGVQWQNRAHFFGVSAHLMRQILVQFARRNHYQKRGGGAQKLSLEEGLVVSKDRTAGLVALDDALKALAVAHPRISQVVELRFFGGLNQEETAEVLGVSSDTVLRDWRFAKVWLHRELRKEQE
jgi:RNA polymerase sigma factor (TIGR02999 family)